VGGCGGSGRREEKREGGVDDITESFPPSRDGKNDRFRPLVVFATLRRNGSGQKIALRDRDCSKKKESMIGLFLIDPCWNRHL
jgi:hypothetical protein